MDNNPDFLFYFDHPAVPAFPPALGSAKLWELEADIYIHRSQDRSADL